MDTTVLYVLGKWPSSLVWCLVRSSGYDRRIRKNRADSWDRWKRALKAWQSRLDWVALVPELWALAKEKRNRRWEKEPDAASAIRKPPGPISHSRGSLASGPSSCSLGLMALRREGKGTSWLFGH